MNKLSCTRAVLMLLLSMALLTGCAAKGRIPAEAVPPLPKPEFRFVEKDGMSCLDDSNAVLFFRWVLAVERYEAAIRGAK